MNIGADMVIDTVDRIIDGTLTTSPQPEGEFTPAPKIFKEDCRILWNRSARDIHNHIRGLSPYPTAFSTLTEANGKSMDVKIFESALNNDFKFPEDARPGTVAVSGKSLYVKTGDDAIEIKSLQPSGKKRMETSAFLLGYHPVEFISPSSSES